MKKLIIITGLPGVGKSTLAEDIANSLQIPIFSVDPIESSIISSGITKSFETGLAAYLVAETLAGEQLKLGISTIIDAVSPVKESREMWSNLAKTSNAKLIVIECVLEEKIHKKRIESRIRNMPGIPELKWTDLEKTRLMYIDWQIERLVINTAKDKKLNLTKAIKYINSK